MTDLRGKIVNAIWDNTDCIKPHAEVAADVIIAAIRENVPSLNWRDGKISDNGFRETAESILGTYEVIQWSSGDFGGTYAHRDDEKGVEFGGLSSASFARSTANAHHVSTLLRAMGIEEQDND